MGPGLHEGLITDIFGPPGSAKTQVCFSLCSRCALAGDLALFIDTAGTFRPERIAEIAGSNSVLSRITILRTLTLADQLRALEMIPEIGPKLIVVDSLTALFSSETFGPSRHLALMRYMHDLALLTIKGKYHVVVTNMVRAVIHQQGETQETRETREFLGSSVSLYAHMRLRLDVVNSWNSTFSAEALHQGENKALFRVAKTGVVDVSE